MGEVYEARHLVDHSRLAIKMIRPELVGDERIRGMFIREASILRRIGHDAIVGYEGLLQDEQGRGLLIMSFVDGPSLAEHIKYKRLSDHEGYALLRRLAEGLHAAHQEGAFHRDLSPDNILLPAGKLEQAVIIDFGIAKLQDPGHKSFVGNDVAGKAGYMSPEQLGVIPTEIDGRTDIYSLALVIAASVRGRPVEMGRSWGEVVDARRRIPSLDGIGEPLRSKLAAMLAPAPEERPQTMQALLAVPNDENGRSPMRIFSIAVGVALLLVLVGVAYMLIIPPDTRLDVADPEPPIEAEPSLPENPDTPAETAAAESPSYGDSQASHEQTVADLTPKPTTPAPATQNQELAAVPSALDAEVIKAVIENNLKVFDCARIDVDVSAAGDVRLGGEVAWPSHVQMAERAARVVPGVAAVSSALQVASDPLCAASTIARVIATGGMPAPTLAPNHADATYYEGDQLVVNATVPAGMSGYLYVDYIDEAGQVVHLRPNPLQPEKRVSGAENIRLGALASEARPDERVYAIGPPFGRSIIVAWLSPTQLFSEMRSEVENAAAYLADLERVLLPVPRAAASFTYVQTRPGS